MSASTTASIASNTVHKGDVLATARVAGIQAVAQATSLLPMSPSVPVSSTFIDFTIGDTHIDVEACVEASERAGVEMAALSAVTVAALTVYDMCKSVDRTMTIGDVCVWENPASGESTRRREDSLAAGEEKSEH
jgi:cyclic pyranopterin phosphate synthase